MKRVCSEACFHWMLRMAIRPYMMASFADFTLQGANNTYFWSGP